MAYKKKIKHCEFLTDDEVENIKATCVMFTYAKRKSVTFDYHDFCGVFEIEEKSGVDKENQMKSVEQLLEMKPADGENIEFIFRKDVDYID